MLWRKFATELIVAELLIIFVFIILLRISVGLLTGDDVTDLVMNVCV